MRKRRLLFLICAVTITALLMSCLLIACNKPKEEEPEPPIGTNPIKLTTDAALGKIYDGLIDGGNSIATASDYGVSNVFTVYFYNILNYTVTYKANYRANKPDSKIYLAAFDNNANLNRIEVYYNAGDLFLRFAEGSYVVSQFGATMMFDMFYDFCRKADTTPYFFGETLGGLFNPNSTDLNLSMILGSSNITYNMAGSDREYVELNNLDLSALGDSVISPQLDRLFDGLGTKYDIITKKFLGFNLSRITNVRFKSINAERLGFGLKGQEAMDTAWSVKGKTRDGADYSLTAELCHDDGQTAIAEGGSFVKSAFTEATLGKNKFLGTALIPQISDKEFDVQVNTDINVANNALNRAQIELAYSDGTNFVSAYYTDEQGFADARGLEKWLDGAIDLKAFNLPKIYSDSIDVSQLIRAGYTSLNRVLGKLLQKGPDGSPVDKEIYDAILENFDNDGKSTIFYTVTEALIQKITGDDTPTITRLAELLNVDEERLKSFIPEEFFSTAELVISYNLDTGEVGIVLRTQGTDMLIIKVRREAFGGVALPEDVYAGSPAYSRFKLPEVITMELEAEFNVRNGQKETDLSRSLGVFAGDPTGKNTQEKLLENETLVLRGSVSEKYVISDGKTVTVNTVNLELSKRVGGVETPIMTVVTSPFNSKEVLITYCLPMGIGRNNGPVKYRLEKVVVQEGFNEILEGRSIFDESNIFNILERILTSDGISVISKIAGWFRFSLKVSADADPVYDLIGIRNTTADVRARVIFTEIPVDIKASDFVKPVIDSLDNVTVESIYSEGSAWRTEVFVFINDERIAMTPTYTEESTNVVTGKTRYNPRAFLFGQEVTYILHILDEKNGTGRVDGILDDIIIIDPAFTNRLPTEIAVRFDTGDTGVLPCTIENFKESNVNYSGYNMQGFAIDKKDFTEDMRSELIIGRNSIMQVKYPVYVLVHNRNIIPYDVSGGNGQDNNGVMVVGSVVIDPYTFAMHRLDDPDYNPVLAAIAEQEMELRFNGVYGKEEVEEIQEIDGAEVSVTVERDLVYDIAGINRFNLADLDLDWEYDLEKINWRGDSGYAYAYYGEGDTAIKFAVKVIVKAQVVESVNIDGQSSAYTIDFLVFDTYKIPTVTNAEHTVKINFRGDLTNSKVRTVTLTRPDIPAEEFYDNYLLLSLDWVGTENINFNTITKDYGAVNLFGKDNTTYAFFGSQINMLDQQVMLSVDVPTRYISSDAGDNKTLANRCEIVDKEVKFYNSTVRLTRAYFPADATHTYGVNDPYLFNPYDRAAVLPDTIYLEVNRDSSYNSEKVFKEYAVKWVSTDKDGRELNLIKFKPEAGGYGLANPVTFSQDMFVYGKVGDRGSDESDYVWIVMSVRNLPSNLQSIGFDGLEDGEDTIYIDPYKPYSLPAGFTAVLESGNAITETDIIWEIKRNGSTKWYPAVFTEGCEENRYHDGKFIFDREGGAYTIRYVIEGDGDIIRQEITLNVEVAARTLEKTRINIYDDGAQPVVGLLDIDYYSAESNKLFERLRAIADGADSGVCFTENISGGAYEVYSLRVDWIRAAEGETGYEYSLDRLMALLSSASSAGQSMVLKGHIYKDTVNQQTLEIEVSFQNLVLETLQFNNLIAAVRNNAVTITELNDIKLNFADIKDTMTLNIRLNKPFGLTTPDADGRQRYASPSVYLSYLFDSLTANFKNGKTDTFRPVLDFCEHADKALMDTQILTFGTTVTLKLSKLSLGSAIDEIILIITAPVDTELDTSKAIVAELFNYDDTHSDSEIYSTRSPYLLPAYIDVEYALSGTVRYQVPIWNIEKEYRAYFNQADKTNAIPVTLINTLERNNVQSGNYNFYYELPCTGKTYSITVSIERQDLRYTYYSAKGDTALYDITDGILDIDNPYLYYAPNSDYGIDVAKIPTIIVADTENNSGYYTDIEHPEHKVSWTFIKNVFTTALFKEGTPDSGILFATAELPAYYNSLGESQTQVVRLYIRLHSLDFYGISYGKLPVLEKDGIKNYIEIDPYDDVMNYQGDFFLPKDGLTVMFRYQGLPIDQVFNNVVFKLCDAEGDPIIEISRIPYNELGHSLDIDGLGEGALRLSMHIPGFESGIKIWVHIKSRIINNVNVPNLANKPDGTTEIKELPSIYYIDPYDDATFSLPRAVNINFRGDDPDDYSVQEVSEWEIKSGKKYVGLSEHPNFYSRGKDGDVSVSYGFYQATRDSYKGATYDMRGSISLGGNKRQYFTVVVIVLNRSLKTEYGVSYRFDDPMGGVLADIPSELNEEMFVEYDKYYAELGLEPKYYYSAFSAPVLPWVNWEIYRDEEGNKQYNDPSIVDYKGGFNLDIKGSVYGANRNKDYLYGEIADEVYAAFGELIKARMWDSYFFSEGNPLAAYSANTATKLKAAAAALEEEVIYATYLLTVEHFTQTDPDKASELTDGLINIIAAETGMSINYERENIVVYMFDMLNKNYATRPNDKSAHAVIYRQWKEIYNEFKSQGSLIDPKLSPYQVLKAAKYDDANSTDPIKACFSVSEQNNFNKKMYNAIEKSIIIYRNAAIWDEMYELSSDGERARMSELLRGTVAEAKSVALLLYCSENLLRLGNSGESAAAHISAPSYGIGNILDEDGNVLSEFLFNVYTTIAFMAGVEVEVVMNYGDILSDYVHEGISEALNSFRGDDDKAFYDEYMKQKVAEYVHERMVPREYNNLGDLVPLPAFDDFDYIEYIEIDAAGGKYWNALYNNAQSKTDTYITQLTESYNYDQSSWLAIRNAHLHNAGDADVVEKMDALMVKYDKSINKYSLAFTDYCDFIRKRNMQEYDDILEEAGQSVDAKLANELLGRNSAFSAVLNDNTNNMMHVFQKMFASKGNDMYDTLYRSFASAPAKQTAISDKLRDSEELPAGTMYAIMYSTGMDSAIIQRATYIYNYYLGAYEAYDMLYEAPETVGLTRAVMDELLTGFRANNPDLCTVMSNDEENMNFAKYCTFARIRSYYSSDNDKSRVLTAYYDAAVEKELAKAYREIIAGYETANKPALVSSLRECRSTVGDIERKAFNIYLSRFVEAAEEELSDITAERVAAYNEVIFARAVRTLLDLSADADYTEYLNGHDESNLGRQAVLRYVEEYATEEETNIINAALAIGQDYSDLMERADIDDKLKAGLRGVFAELMLEAAIADIRTDIEHQYNLGPSSPNDLSQDFDYQTIKEGFGGLFTAVGGTSTGMVIYREQAALSVYQDKLVSDYIVGYTDRKDNAAIEAADAGYRAALDLARDRDRAIVDAILQAYYDSLPANIKTLSSRAYAAMLEIMKEEALYDYHTSRESEADERAFAVVYDGLGKYGPQSSGTADGKVHNAVASISATYNSVVASMADYELSAWNNIIDGSHFTLGEEDIEREKLADMFAYYEVFITIDTNRLSDYADIITEKIESVAQGIIDDMMGSGVLAMELTEAVINEQACRGAVNSSVRKVRTAAQLIELLYGIDTVCAQMDHGKLSYENLQGDYRVTDAEFRAEYIKGLREMFREQGINGAVIIIDRIANQERSKWLGLGIADAGYSEFSAAVMTRIAMTADHIYLTDGMDMQGFEQVRRQTVDDFMQSLLSEESYLITQQTNRTDAEYEAVFGEINGDINMTVVFYTEDNLSAGGDDRHVVFFSKDTLIDSHEDSVSAPVYLGNAHKINAERTNTYRRDNVGYRYTQINIGFVDFSGEEVVLDVDSANNNDNLNSLTIDPLAPYLPDKVRAYGVYGTGANRRLLDLGEVDMRYDALFYENTCYDGQKGDRSYIIHPVDSYGVEHSLGIDVTYLDRRVKEILFENNNFGGYAVNRQDFDYNGYYSIYDEDERTNIVSLNPAKQEILDTFNRQYKMPERMVVLFGDGSEVAYYSDVVWDMSGVEYSLKGTVNNIRMRILSFTVTDDDNNKQRVDFDYTNSKIRISELNADGDVIGTPVDKFSGVPDYAIWNIGLKKLSRIATALYSEENLLGQYNAADDVIDVDAKGLNNEYLFTINPYDVAYPADCKITLDGNSEGDVKFDESTWRPEPGEYGEQKLQRIIFSSTGDNRVVLNFSYLGYTVRVRVVADNIKISGTGGGAYLDGGVIYLVRGGGVANEQLLRNYSYLYYNFGTVGAPDYRKVPLSFISTNVTDIDTESVGSYSNVLGVLGWDKLLYPNVVVSNNISFTIMVVDPVMYAYLDRDNGEFNPYVSFDYIATPHDSNYQKRKDNSEPDGADYFVQINDGSENLMFAIDKNSIKYDIIGRTVAYECRFEMSSSTASLAADASGSKIITFTVTVPLDAYLYTEVSGVKFDKTPKRDNFGNEIWQWTDVSDKDPDYRDTIIWPLGRAMRASDLPDVLTAENKRIKLLWELDGVNINRANEFGYIVTGWYYDSDGRWCDKELVIVIKKVNVSAQIVEAAGGNMVIRKTYDGRYYRLPLDLDAPELSVLRADHTKGRLENVLVEYKAKDDNDYHYSTTEYPINAGIYNVRVTVDDYNAEISGELVFTVEIVPMTIVANNIRFENESRTTVTYTYDGTDKPLKVQELNGGLPWVDVDNWFGSREEKDALVKVFTDQPGYTVVTAKSAAYNTLYRNVSRPTKTKMDELMASVAASTGLNGDNLAAAVWDILEYNWKICEVVYSVTYMNGDTVLTGAPVDVGSYTARFTIDAERNQGNYVLNAVSMSRFIEIKQPDVHYSYTAVTLNYTGKLQNPRINGLHDANGKLPVGVTVDYSYSYMDNGTLKYLNGGIINVGTYICEATIHGGNNYPDGSLAETLITIMPQRLYIHVEDASSYYLAPVADLNDLLYFEGLVNDYPASFGYASVGTEVKSYYTLGVYDVYFNGFCPAENSDIYTELTGEYYSINGKEYRRLVLKSADQDGSLYTILTADNRYVYQDLITKFSNYEIYVCDIGKYEVKAEDDAIIVGSDEALATVLSGVQEAQSVKIYLTAMYDEDGISVPYSAITVDVNAEITITGCYDADQNIVTVIEGVTVLNGAVNLRILAFNAIENSGVNLMIGDDADGINVTDCTFTNVGYINTVAILTDTGYADKLYIGNTSFVGYQRGIELVSGNLELGGGSKGNLFSNNYYGVSITSQAKDIRISDATFVEQSVGIYSNNTATVVLNNTFDRNRCAVNIVGGNRDTLREQNFFGSKNATDIDVG